MELNQCNDYNVIDKDMLMLLQLGLNSSLITEISIGQDTLIYTTFFIKKGGGIELA